MQGLDIRGFEVRGNGRDIRRKQNCEDCPLNLASEIGPQISFLCLYNIRQFSEFFAADSFAILLLVVPRKRHILFSRFVLKVEIYPKNWIFLWLTAVSPQILLHHRKILIFGCNSIAFACCPQRIMKQLCYLHSRS